MAYRSLMVHLDTDECCDARITLAAKLATEHAAHLMGVAGGVHASALGNMFLARMKQLGHAAAGFRAEEGTSPECVARHAQHCDLAILGKPVEGSTVSDDFTARFFLRAGRPTLILPEVFPLEVTQGGVLMAWNGTRESARAMADALPWLRRAREVGVLCLERSDDELFSRLELNDLRDWLKRHGVAAHVTQTPARGRVGDDLLEWVHHTKADLLVMGGYGHSPAAESVFGGVTRSVLSAMPVPVLVSH
jgi:nucleotide-binding universal stress UspA family protein